MNNAIWNEKEKRWTVRHYEGGTVKKFTSSRPGLAGKKEVMRRYRNWLEYGSEDRSKTLATIVWDNFIHSVEKRLGRETEAYKLYEKIGRLYIVPALGKKKMINLSKRDFQEIIDNAKPQNKRTKVLSEKYLNSIRMVINLYVKYAEENDFFEGIKGNLYIPKGHPTKGKEILQPEDIKKLFQPSDLHYHKALCFMLVTGLRPSELLGLKWSDIKGDHIEIVRGVNTSNQITKGKNANARRLIPLTPLLNNLLNIQRTNTIDLNSEWVFCSKSGAVGSQSTLANHFRVLQEERGIAGCLYSFRHTFISMVKNSMPEQMIKQLVGHSVSFDSFGTYGHIVNGELQQAAKLIDLSFSSSIEVSSNGDQ